MKIPKRFISLLMSAALALALFAVPSGLSLSAAEVSASSFSELMTKIGEGETQIRLTDVVTIDVSAVSTYAVYAKIDMKSPNPAPVYIYAAANKRHLNVTATSALTLDLTGLIFDGEAPTMTWDGDGNFTNETYNRGGLTMAASTNVTILGGTVQNCAVYGALARGGGILASGVLTLRDTEVLNNRAVGSTTALGGGVFANGASSGSQANWETSTPGVYATPSVLTGKTLISGNVSCSLGSLAKGGGVTELYGIIIEEDAVISRNTVVSSSSVQGGGLSGYVSLTIPKYLHIHDNAKIVDNVAESIGPLSKAKDGSAWGGGVGMETAYCHIEITGDAEISRNIARSVQGLGEGGGLSLTSMIFSNTLKNPYWSAYIGGNVTIADNQGVGNGGGLHFASQGDLTIAGDMNGAGVVISGNSVSTDMSVSGDSYGGGLGINSMNSEVNIGGKVSIVGNNAAVGGGISYGSKYYRDAGRSSTLNLGSEPFNEILIADNVAKYVGGGIADGSPVSLAYTDNSGIAPMYFGFTEPLVITPDVTITRNRALGQGSLLKRPDISGPTTPSQYLSFDVDTGYGGGIYMPDISKLTLPANPADIHISGNSASKKGSRAYTDFAALFGEAAAGKFKANDDISSYVYNAQTVKKTYTVENAGDKVSLTEAELLSALVSSMSDKTFPSLDGKTKADFVSGNLRLVDTSGGSYLFTAGQTKDFAVGSYAVWVEYTTGEHAAEWTWDWDGAIPSFGGYSAVADPAPFILGFPVAFEVVEKPEDAEQPPVVVVPPDTVTTPSPTPDPTPTPTSTTAPTETPAPSVTPPPSPAPSETPGDTPSETPPTATPEAPPLVVNTDNLVPTPVEDVYEYFDDEGNPLGYVKLIVNENGDEEWIFVDSDGNPLGAPPIKTNPPTGGSFLGAALIAEITSAAILVYYVRRRRKTA